MHDGDYRSPERVTLGDYLSERWLPTKKAQLRPSTFASYRNNVDIHINPRIGHILLQKLQPEDLDTFYAQLLADGRRNGKGGGDVSDHRKSRFAIIECRGEACVLVGGW